MDEHKRGKWYPARDKCPHCGKTTEILCGYYVDDWGDEHETEDAERCTKCGWKVSFR